MASRDEQTIPHQNHLSSLAVHPSDSKGGSGTDYKLGEVHLYSHSKRYFEEQEYHPRALSSSLVRRYGHEFDHSSERRRGRGFGGGTEALRSPGRYRDYSIRETSLSSSMTN